MSDFTDYDPRSRLSAQINAGYSARLNGQRLSDNPHLGWVDGQPSPMSDKGEAWQHGWRAADRDEKKAGAR